MLDRNLILSLLAGLAILTVFCLCVSAINMDTWSSNPTGVLFPLTIGVVAITAIRNLLKKL